MPMGCNATVVGSAKTFSALTGTPLSGLHKRGKWLGQAEALREGLTLHKVAEALHIHVSTAHRWRHRFLALPMALQPPTLTGIAEAGATMDCMLKAMDMATLSAALKPFLTKGIVLCTDGS